MKSQVSHQFMLAEKQKSIPISSLQPLSRCSSTISATKQCLKKSNKNQDTMRSQSKSVNFFVAPLLVFVLLPHVMPQTEAVKICGSELIDVFRYVCRGRGIFNPTRQEEPKASLDSLCCEKQCSFEDIERYCQPQRKVNQMPTRKRSSHGRLRHTRYIIPSLPVVVHYRIPIISSTTGVTATTTSLQPISSGGLAQTSKLLNQIKHNFQKSTSNNAMAPSTGSKSNRIRPSRSSNRKHSNNPNGIHFKKRSKNLKKKTKFFLPHPKIAEPQSVNIKHRRKMKILKSEKRPDLRHITIV